MTGIEIAVLFNVSAAIVQGAFGNWLAACLHIVVVLALIILEIRYDR